jgi:hypothetical protein
MSSALKFKTINRRLGVCDYDFWRPLGEGSVIFGGGGGAPDMPLNSKY